MAAPLPTITSGIDDWDSFEEDCFDPTIRNTNADGRPLARTGTQPILRWWRYMRRAINTADKATWQTWQEDTVRIGGEPWSWTDPRPSGAAYTVRLGAPIKFSPTRHKLGYYDALIYLVEEGVGTSASASPSASPSASASAS